MANLDGVNYAQINTAVPATKITPGEADGRKRIIFESYDVADAVLAGSDVLRMGAEIPAGARVLACNVYFTASLAATSDINFGWAASADAGEAADDNGLLDAVDASSAGTDATAVGDAGHLKVFTESVQIEATVVTATTPTATGILYLVLEYIRD